MSEKSGIDLNQIILLAALAGGGYLALKYLLPALKDLGSVSGAVSSAAGAVSQAGDVLTKPIVELPKTYPEALSPLNLIIPGTAIPKVLDWLKTPTGGKGTPTVSFLGSLFPPLAVFEATLNLLKGPPKTTAAQTPKIIGPQTSTRLQPLTMVTAPAERTIIGTKITTLGAGPLNTVVTPIYGKAQIPSLALSQKLRGLA